VPVDLGAGRHQAELRPQEGDAAVTSAPVVVPDPAADVAIVSDIDDTILDSGIAPGDCSRP
jgi:phosphatidate phosphatase APP1